MSWTDDRVERLKKLWADGLSASQIAAELGGITRNAVIGKVHRLGLSGRAKSGGTSSASRVKRARAPSYNRPRRPSGGSVGNLALSYHVDEMPATNPRLRAMDENVVVPMSKKLTLVELNEDTCKWPSGDPATDDFHFCGHSVREGGPYCEFHAGVAFQPASAERRRDRRAIR